jgi:hypothetical protein
VIHKGGRSSSVDLYHLAIGRCIICAVNKVPLHKHRRTDTSGPDGLVLARLTVFTASV